MLYILKRINITLFFSLICSSLWPLPPIKLGVSTVLSGPSKNLGMQYNMGARLYFDKVNAGNGINGRKIELIIYDDTYNPNPCINNTKKLIIEDRVDLLFNYVGTPTTTAMLPLLKIYSESNIILFGNLSGAGGQRTPPYDQFVYNIRPSYRQETEKLVDFFYKKGLKKIGVIYQIDGYGRSGFVGVKSKLKELGGTITAEASYSRGQSFDQSMTTQVEHMKSMKVDCIISVGSYEACAAFIRDSRKGNLMVPIANISFVGSESLTNLLTLNRLPIENLYFSEVVPYYKNSTLPVVKEYNERLQEKGLKPNFISLEGYINAKLLAMILEASSQIIKRENIKDIISNMPHIDIGLEEKLKFEDDSNQILHKVYLYTLLENGELGEVK